MNNLTMLLPSATKSAALDTGIALGLGLTNECNLACAFCYRNPTRTDRLSLDQVKLVLEGLPVRSVNLGTGENGMHPVQHGAPRNRASIGQDWVSRSRIWSKQGQTS